MKRTAILFLALALFLTACSRAPTPGTAEAAVTTTQAPVPTEPSTVSTAESSKPDSNHTTEDPDADSEEDLDWEEPETTEPTEQPTEPSEDYEAWTVYTDWSAYRPYSGSQAKYTRLREEFLDHFEPSEDYGAVYPYVASQVDLTPDYEDWSYGNYYSYGIVDRTGRVLTDGIYRSVDPMRNYAWELGTPNSYWVVCRMVGSETKSYEYDGKTYSYVSPDYRYGLISMDGSRMLECRYTGISDMGCGLLCRNSEEPSDFEVLSYDLELMFSGTKVFQGAGACDWWDLKYSEGMLFVLTAREVDLRDENGNYTYTETRYEDWFCDENGNRVCGPYADAANFSEGLACVSVDGERYGYIDKTGAWAIEPIFRSCHAFRNGKALQRTAEGRIVLIDHTGSVCCQLADGDAYEYEYGYHVIRTVGEDTYRYAYYDFDGTLLCEGERLQWLDERIFCTYPVSNSLRFFTPERELITVDAKNAYPERGAAMKDGELLLGWYAGWDGDYEAELFVPEDFSKVIEVPKRAYPTSDTYGTHVYEADPVTGETWYFCWTGRAWEGRTEAGDRITVPLQSRCPEPAGDLVAARTDQASWLLTHEGEIVFCDPFDTGD